MKGIPVMATTRTTARKATGATKKAASNAPATETKKRADLVCKIGNIGKLENDAIELRITPNGKSVCNFDIAVNFKVNDEKVTEWYRITCWEQLAENVVASLNTGDRVMVFGVPSVEEFERKDGTQGKQKKINAWNVGLELSYVTVGEVSKIERNSDYYNDEEPF